MDSGALISTFQFTDTGGEYWRRVTSSPDSGFHAHITGLSTATGHWPDLKARDHHGELTRGVTLERVEAKERQKKQNEERRRQGLPVAAQTFLTDLSAIGEIRGDERQQRIQAWIENCQEVGLSEVMDRGLDDDADVETFADTSLGGIQQQEMSRTIELGRLEKAHETCERAFEMWKQTKDETAPDGDADREADEGDFVVS